MLFLLLPLAVAVCQSPSSNPRSREVGTSPVLEEWLLEGASLFVSPQPSSSGAFQPPRDGAEGVPAFAPPAAREDRPEGEEYANIYPKFTLSAGVLLLENFNSSIQVSGDAGAGVVVDMEDLLDVDSDATVGRIDLHYSFNKRHWVDAAYYDIQRSGSTSATTEDIDFGDVTIPAGSSVDADFGTRIFKLAYRYNFVTDERTVIGASLGVHSLGLNVKLDAAAISVDETFKQELPLPLVGLHGAYALSRKWSLLADVELLQFDLGSYRGFVGDSRVALNHDTFDHWGWGVSINNFRVEADAEGNDGLEANFDYGYEGLMAYLRFYL